MHPPALQVLRTPVLRSLPSCWWAAVELVSPASTRPPLHTPCLSACDEASRKHFTLSPSSAAPPAPTPSPLVLLAPLVHWSCWPHRRPLLPQPLVCHWPL